MPKAMNGLRVTLSDRFIVCGLTFRSAIVAHLRYPSFQAALLGRHSLRRQVKRYNSHHDSSVQLVKGFPISQW